jgi:hypothetical protein
MTVAINKDSKNLIGLFLDGRKPALDGATSECVALADKTAT